MVRHDEDTITKEDLEKLERLLKKAIETKKTKTRVKAKILIELGYDINTYYGKNTANEAIKIDNSLCYKESSRVYPRVCRPP